MTGITAEHEYLSQVVTYNLKQLKMAITGSISASERAAVRPLTPAAHMNLISGIDITASALTAQKTRLDIIAQTSRTRRPHEHRPAALQAPAHFIPDRIAPPDR